MIKVNNLVKKYGDFIALNQIDFDVEKGTIHGLLGENGAGKTTTMRCLLGLSYADSGEMFIFNKKVTKNSNKLRKDISYLAGDFRSYENMTPLEYFKYILKLENNKSNKFNQLSERFKLDLNKKIKELSKGNKQKVGIVQAFMRDSKLMILDEPTSGLDPNFQRVFRELIFEEKEKGKTILLSSHDLLEISNCCDFVTIIKEGVVISSQSKSEISKKSLKKIKVKFETSPDISEIRQLKYIKNHTIDGDESIFMITGDIDHFLKFISKYKILDLDTESSSLSDTLLEYF